MKACANSIRAKKAQVSLEFLVLLMAFMTFMSLWLSLILVVKNGIGDSIEFSKLEAIGSDIRETCDAVCLMGPGSSRTVGVEMDAKTEFFGKKITLYAGKAKTEEILRCRINSATISLDKNDELVVKNIGGMVSVSELPKP